MKSNVMKILLVLIFASLFVGCDQVQNKEDIGEILDNLSQDDIQKIKDTTSEIIDIPNKTVDVKEVISDNISNLENKEIFEENINTPISKFTKEDITNLNVNCAGTDEEIVDCVTKWQEENMIYVPTTNINYNFNPSYSLRWNEILPGIYTSKDMIKENVYNGKPYGICFDFSTIYCSIVQYYGIDCRIVSTKSKISDGVGDYNLPTSGLSQSEFNELKPWLEKKDLDYEYEAVRLTLEEGPGHYWAEVHLNNKWISKDATPNSAGIKYTQENDYVIVNWKDKDKSEQLKNYTLRIRNGENLANQNAGNNSDIDEFMQGRAQYESDLQEGREEVYQGITDELGNKNRAETIDDYMQGKALAPYFSSCTDSCDFIKGGNNCKNGCEVLDEIPAACYNSCSGEKYFTVCDYICEDASDSQWASCYEACSGNKLNLKCEDKCFFD